jgi:hypothetical protein
MVRYVGDAGLGLPLLRYVHDRHKLRGAGAKHGGAPVRDDVDLRPIRPDITPKVARSPAQIRLVSDRNLDLIPVFWRHNVQQSQRKERVFIVTVTGDRDFVHVKHFVRSRCVSGHEACPPETLLEISVTPLPKFWELTMGKARSKRVKHAGIEKSGSIFRSACYGQAFHLTSGAKTAMYKHLLHRGFGAPAA